MENNSRYDSFSKKELLALLKVRDKEIEELRGRNLDDFIRDLIKEEIINNDYRRDTR